MQVLYRFQTRLLWTPTISRQVNFYFTKSKKQQIEHELHNNPYFDKVFPELAKHKEATTVKQEDNEYAYIDSLKKYYKHNKKQLNKTDIDQANHRRFVEGFQSPRGPIKYMSEQEKLKINILIDQKLKELEETGLSREEILSSGRKKGIPLYQDAFFQFVKNNYAAREVYIAENEEYTVQKIVDLALRQELGPDQFSGAPDIRKSIQQLPIFKIREDKMKNKVFTDQKDNQSLINELIKQDKIFAPQNPHIKKERYNQNIREVNNFDIHWRNTEFLSQFLNKCGKIKNRFQTMLTNQQQKKISRTIKASRNMLLLPHANYVYPHFKKSLTTIQDDVEDFIRTKVNLTTGQLYFTILKYFCQSYQETPSIRLDRNMLDLSLQLDYELQVSAPRPEGDDLLLLKAQAYADKKKQEQLIKEGLDVENLKKEDQNNNITNKIAIISNSPQFYAIRNEDAMKKQIEKLSDEQDIEECFEVVKDEIKKIPFENFTDALFYESALNYNQLLNLQEKKPRVKISKEESLSIINQIRDRAGLEKLEI